MRILSVYPVFEPIMPRAQRLIKVAEITSDFTRGILTIIIIIIIIRAGYRFEINR